MDAKKTKRSGAVTITTIEGSRTVTRGSASPAQYAEKRKKLITRSSKVGKSKYA